MSTGKEVTSHQSKILSEVKSQTGRSSHRVSPKRALKVATILLSGSGKGAVGP